MQSHLTESELMAFIKDFCSSCMSPLSADILNTPRSLCQAWVKSSNFSILQRNYISAVSLLISYALCCLTMFHMSTTIIKLEIEANLHNTEVWSHLIAKYELERTVFNSTASKSRNISRHQYGFVKTKIDELWNASVTPPLEVSTPTLQLTRVSTAAQQRKCR